MQRVNNLKLMVFFVLLTVLLTVVVVYAWEQALMTPLYNWFEKNYPGERNADHRWRMAQRIEHFFISIIVDTVVVALLLRVVDRQKRELAASEERYRAIFEHANAGVGVIAASDHRLVDANKKFGDTLGASHQSLVGRHIAEILGSGESGPRELEEMFETCSALSSGQPEQGWVGEREITVRGASGSQIVVAASCSLLQTGKQKLFVLILRDLTEHVQHEREKQEMHRQLYQSSKLASVGELSAGVAHEINNPLNCIINFAQLLKDDNVARNDSERHMLDGIIDEGERIAKIVRDLLTFARQDPATRAPVDVRQCIENSFSLFGRQLEKDGIFVEIDVAPDARPVLADASRLRQVVVNMISNAHHALKAGRREERVFRVAARNVERAGRRLVRIEFYDNGVGIRKENLEKVFDPFFTTRRDSGGTGLGLSLSFGIIQNFGGTLEVESEEGSFTRFIIELPAADSPGTDYAQSIAGRRRAEHPVDDVGVAEA